MATEVELGIEVAGTAAIPFIDALCPIRGIGSDLCIIGQTSLPPGIGQILCGRETQPDPHVCGRTATIGVTLGIEIEVEAESTAEACFSCAIEADGILDGLNPTAAWSASRDLLTAFSGSRYVSGTAPGINLFTDQVENGGDLTQLDGWAAEPRIFPAGDCQRDALFFLPVPGPQQFMEGAAAFSHFCAADEGYMIVSFMPTEITLNEVTRRNNHLLIGTDPGYAGMYLRDSGTPKSGYALNNDTSEDVIPSASGDISYDTAYVMEWRHEGGVLYQRLNLGSWSSTASGDTVNVDVPFQMGGTGSAPGSVYTGLIFEAATWNTVPSVSAQDAIAASFMEWVGVSSEALPWCDDPPFVVSWLPFRTPPALALSNGNLTATSPFGAGVEFTTQCTKGIPDTGKGYFEVLVVNSSASVFSQNINIGIGTRDMNLGFEVGEDVYSWGYNAGTGWKEHSAVYAVYGSAFGTGNVIGVAFNNGKVWFAKDNVWQGGGDPATDSGEAFSGITGTILPSASIGITPHEIVGRFTAADCSYSPPAGFPNWDVA